MTAKKSGDLWATSPAHTKSVSLACALCADDNAAAVTATAASDLKLVFLPMVPSVGRGGTCYSPRRALRSSITRSSMTPFRSARHRLSVQASGKVSVIRDDVKGGSYENSFVIQ